MRCLVLHGKRYGEIAGEKMPVWSVSMNKGRKNICGCSHICMSWWCLIRYPCICAQRVNSIPGGSALLCACVTACAKGLTVISEVTKSDPESVIILLT